MVAKETVGRAAGGVRGSLARMEGRNFVTTGGGRGSLTSTKDWGREFDGMTSHVRTCLDLRFWGREVGHFSARSRRERGEGRGGSSISSRRKWCAECRKIQRVEEREAHVRGTSMSEISGGE